MLRDGKFSLRIVNRRYMKEDVLAVSSDRHVFQISVCGKVGGSISACAVVVDIKTYNDEVVVGCFDMTTEYRDRYLV